jgi:hypothetical protein
MKQLNLRLYINQSNLDELNHINTLVREGWDIVHFAPSQEEDGSDTKVVLIRKMKIN